ncbi:MAG: histidine kinase dimerization/phospho-acceptor domain-containing protein, partial [Stellaceae bacterium]
MRGSIGAKIFGAFIAMSLITGALGVYGLYVLSAAGRIVVYTYDRPLMAVNFARLANLTFSQMDKGWLQRRIAAPEKQADIDRSLDRLTKSFFEDITVAWQRSLAADERAVILEIRDLVTEWGERRSEKAPRSGPAADAEDALARRITERFDMLIELTTDHSFVERRKAVGAIAEFQYTSVVVLVLALLLAAALTLMLARRIIRPLTAAATAADRIARGELEAPIPSGGKDETGILLRSMRVMQDSIRAMIEREAGQRRSAQGRLVDALESSHEAMVLVDADGKIVHANHQLAQFFPDASERLIPGAEFSAEFSTVARGAAPVDLLSSGGEVRLPGGRWARVSRSGTRDGGFLLVVSDFTEVKQREESLSEAKRQAEEANAAKSNFLANMSHELRTPLNAIIGFSEIISTERFGKVQNSRYATYADYILQSGRHLLDIIN